METINTITISADPDTVFKAASDVASWAKMLPHYRWVHQVGGTRGGRTYEMAAWRSWIPVKWTSVTHLDPVKRRIYFKHVGGLTRGMKVVWQIEPHKAGSKVTIRHELLLIKVPVVKSAVGQFVAGRFFIEPVADRTLATMKRWIESKCGEQS